jgi:hypothetical protein
MKEENLVSHIPSLLRSVTKTDYRNDPDIVEPENVSVDKGE